MLKGSYTKYYACLNFFNALAERLGDDYEIYGSCNKDNSLYLIPKGTLADISYYGKPINSFRVSDHWNWYSTLRRCSDPKRIQCYSADLPWARRRPELTEYHSAIKASTPITAAMVGFYGPDGKYHCVYGEAFNRKDRSWLWVDNTVSNVAAMLQTDI